MSVFTLKIAEIAEVGQGKFKLLERQAHLIPPRLVS